MNCPCRSAALRIFVNSIAHIQVPTVIAAARVASRNPISNPLRRLRCLERTATALPIAGSRSLHTTPYRSGKLEAVLGDMRIKTEKSQIDNSHEFTKSTEAPREPSMKRPVAAGGADRKGGKPWKRNKADGEKRGKGGEWKKGKGEWQKGQGKGKEPGKEDEEFRRPSLHELRIEEQDEAGVIRNKKDWRVQKAALKEKFPDGWNPRKKLSPDALTGIRALHAEFPEIYTTEELASKFEVSPENIRRILRSKWVPSTDEEIDRQERWFNRGKKVWSRWAELGKKPPRRWRAEGITRDPIWNEKRGPGDAKSERRKASEAHKKLSESLM